MTTHTGTVTAERAGAAVKLTLLLPAADFLDLVGGLAWVDVLGGFAAWRLVLPIGDQPARYAGTFNLRRTYGDEERTTQPGSATATATPPREDPASAPDARQQAGCSCRGQQGDGARAPADQPLWDDEPSVGVAQSAGAGGAEVEAPGDWGSPIRRWGP